MLGFLLPNPARRSDPPLCNCQWAKNRLFCFDFSSLRAFHNCQCTTQAMTQRFHPLRPCAAQRMICKRLGNDKIAQTPIGNLGNCKKAMP